MKKVEELKRTFGAGPWIVLRFTKTEPRRLAAAAFCPSSRYAEKVMVRTYDTGDWNGKPALKGFCIMFLLAAARSGGLKKPCEYLLAEAGAETWVASAVGALDNPITDSGWRQDLFEAFPKGTAGENGKTEDGLTSLFRKRRIENGKKLQIHHHAASLPKHKICIFSSDGSGDLEETDRVLDEQHLGAFAAEIEEQVPTWTRLLLDLRKRKEGEKKDDERADATHTSRIDELAERIEGLHKVVASIAEQLRSLLNRPDNEAQRAIFAAEARLQEAQREHLALLEQANLHLEALRRRPSPTKPSDLVGVEERVRQALQLVQESGARIEESLREIHFYPTSVSPFVQLREAPGLFGTDMGLQSFMPSLGEYERGLVHAPEILAEVSRQLLDEELRFACVLGRGAAGKSTLAVTVAHSEAFKKWNALYCRIGNEPDVGALVGAIETIGARFGHDCLVVLDDIHLAEAEVAQLFSQWRDLPRRPRLLMLGRKVTPEGAHRGAASPLENIAKDAAELRVGPSDLVGVAKRLLNRTGRPLPANWPPDQATVTAWMRDFGGDLVAFACAVRARVNDLLRGSMQIPPEAAQQYVATEYLTGIETSERSQLHLLAAAAELEAWVPAECLPTPISLNRSEAKGIVVQRATGLFGERTLYGFAHPSMGRLIAASAGMDSAERQRLLLKLVAGHPRLAVLLARRVRTAAPHASAQGGDVRDQISALITAGFSSPATLVTCFEGNLGRFNASKRLFAMTPDCLGRFGSWIESEPSVRDAFRASALDSALPVLADFLSFARREMPTVARMLEGFLRTPAGNEAILKRIRDEGWGYLPQFVRAIESEIPDLKTTIAREVASTPVQEFIRRAAPGGSGYYFSGLLDFASAVTPGLPRKLEEWADNVTAEEAQRTIRPTTLSGFGSLLDVLEKRGLKRLLAKALNLLDSEVGRDLLAAGIEELRFPELVAIHHLLGRTDGERDEVALRALREVLESDCGKNAVRLLGRRPHLIGHAFKLLATCGLDAMGRRAAIETLQAADRNALLAVEEPLEVIAAVLRFSWEADDETVRRFLTTVLPDGDLRFLLGNKPNLTAKALLSLWSSAKGDVIRYFAGRLPKRRFRMFIEALASGPSNPKHIGCALQLVGALRCLGAEAASGIRELRLRPAPEIVKPVETFTQGGLDQENARFGLAMPCLWVGLRTIGPSLPNARISAAVGTLILSAWRRVAPMSRNMQALNLWMIEWLNKCERNDWRLIADNTPPPTRLDPPACFAA